MSPTPWTLESILWDQFTSEAVDDNILSIVKTAGLVEHAAGESADLLSRVFVDDPVMSEFIKAWAAEEAQHGAALRRWIERADPSYDFEAGVRRFREIGADPERSKTSTVEGSRWFELIGLCIFETGTSAFYSALRDAAREPVLRQLCQHIAADEFRHFSFFHRRLKDCLGQEKVGPLARAKAAISRLHEIKYGEMAGAYHAATQGDCPYNCRWAAEACEHSALRLYQRRHVGQIVAMIGKVCGVNVKSVSGQVVGAVAWWIIMGKVRQAARARPETGNAARDRHLMVRPPTSHRPGAAGIG